MKNYRELNMNTNKLLLAFVGLMLLFGCNDSSNNECTTCNTESKRQTEFTIGEKTTTFNLWDERDDVNNTNINYALLLPKDRVVSRNEIEKILNYYKFYDLIDIEEKNKYEIMSMILFTKQNILQNKILKKGNINGLLIYFKGDNKIFSRVYEVQDAKLLNIKELNSTPKRVTTNAYYYCSKIFGGYNEKITAISFINSEVIYPTNKKGDDFELILKNYIIKIKDNNIFSKEKAVSNCNFPCSSTPFSYCGELQGDITCLGTCRMTESKDLIENSGASFLLDINKLYDFRDNFLSGKNKGEEYIQYYYDISYYLIDNLTLSIVTDGMNIAINHIIPSIDKLMNDPTSSNILYNQNVKNDIINFLNNIKSLSNDPNFINMIDQIILDVNSNVNKPVNQVVTFFN